MTRSVIVDPAAEMDIAEAAGWYEANGSGLGDAFVRAVDVGLARIGRMPEAYARVEHDVRRILLEGATENPLRLRFVADRCGPYADQLRHLLDALDGNYLHCDKRLSEAGPFEQIRFEDAQRGSLTLYLTGPGAEFLPALRQRRPSSTASNRPSEWNSSRRSIGCGRRRIASLRLQQ